MKRRFTHVFFQAGVGNYSLAGVRTGDNTIFVLHIIPIILSRQKSTLLMTRVKRHILLWQAYLFSNIQYVGSAQPYLNAFIIDIFDMAGEVVNLKPIHLTYIHISIPSSVLLSFN